MNKQDYDKYYQQGGSYVIPVEIFNELFEDYECFKNDCKKYKEVIDKLKDKTKENIENAECEVTTLTIGDKAYYQYIEKILNNYVDILKEVE